MSIDQDICLLCEVDTHQRTCEVCPQKLSPTSIYKGQRWRTWTARSQKPTQAWRGWERLAEPPPQESNTPRTHGTRDYLRFKIGQLKATRSGVDGKRKFWDLIFVKGRTARKRYLLTLFVALTLLNGIIFSHMFSHMLPMAPSTSDAQNVVSSLFQVSFALLLYVIGITLLFLSFTLVVMVNISRLHDQGRSGKWLLLVPVSLISSLIIDEPLYGLYALLGFIFLQAILPSDPKENRFGPTPASLAAEIDELTKSLERHEFMGEDE